MIEDFVDEFGPELLLETHDRDSLTNAYFILDNTSLGPALGGIMMREDANTIYTLRKAKTSTIRNAVLCLPFGGGAASIRINPGAVDREMRLGLIRQLAKVLSPYAIRKFIACPDQGTGQEEMRVFAEEMRSWNASTGKPRDFTTGRRRKQGMPYELGAIGEGIAASICCLTTTVGRSIRGASLVIDGMGNNELMAAIRLEAMGCRVVAVSDSEATVHDANGIRVAELFKAMQAGINVSRLVKYERLEREEIFSLPADIMILTGFSGTLSRKAAEKLKASLVVESSGHELEEESEFVLHQREIVVLPDALSNGGGAISSYAELNGKSLEETFNLIGERTRESLKRVVERSEEKEITLRQATLEIARDSLRKSQKVIKEL